MVRQGGDLYNNIFNHWYLPRAHKIGCPWNCCSLNTYTLSLPKVTTDATRLLLYDDVLINKRKLKMKHSSINPGLARTFLSQLKNITQGLSFW